MKVRKRILPLLLVVSLISANLVPMQSDASGKKEKSAVTIDVTDYGADPTGASDSAVAIQEAIAAAKEQTDDGKSVVIEFPEGRYDIYPDKAAERELYISNTVGADQNYKDKKIGILLEDMDNVTVDGNGSLFMFHGKMMTFAAIDCENVLFTDYIVDFQVPTVIDITVEEVTGNTATIYVPECYNYQIDGTSINWLSDVSPYSGECYWTTRNSMNYTQVFDTVAGLTWRGGNPVFSNVASIEDMGNHRLKFTYRSTPGVTKGYCYQMRTTVRDHAGTFFWKSKNVELKNLDIHFLHGFGMVGQHSENITLDNVDFETPASSGRTTAGYADFIQMSGCKGKIDISGCTFSNPHDDPINIHGTFNQVVQKIADNKIKVRYMHNETAGFPNFFVGDQVEFMTKGNMIPVADSVRTVVAVDGPDGRGGDMGEGSSSLTDIILTFDEAIPSEIAVNQHVVENITYTPEVSIKNNIFKETPTRGILVTTRKPVVIENNKFDGMGMASIYISNDAQGWYESGPTKDVTIRNNVFSRGRAQAIYVEPTNPTVSTTQTVHSNMTIEDNIFFMENQRVLDAKSVKNLTFRNNKIYRQDPNVTLLTRSFNTNLTVGSSEALVLHASGASLSTQAYRFIGCQNVVVEGNTYDGGINAGSSLTAMTNGDVTVKDDIMTVNSGSNMTDRIGKVYYESSDESVVKVSAGGVVTAVGAGEASVRAYAVAGGRKYVGNTVDFTVEGEAGVLPSDIEILTETEVVDVNNTVQYEAEVTAQAGADTSIAWSVVDAVSGQACEAAEISEEGLLTAKDGGVVEVIARTVNGLESRKLLVISKAATVLAENFNVEYDTGERYVLKDDAIEMQFTNGGLYQEQVPKNVIVGDVDMSGDVVEATIRVDGRTEGSWAAMGFYFYKDADNYVSVERKHRGGSTRRIALVREVGQRANETWLGGSESAGPTVDDQVVYLKLRKENNTITAFYSLDGSEYVTVGSCDGAFLGEEFKVAIATLTDERSGNDAKATYSELTVNGESIPLTRMALGNLPNVSDIQVTYTEEANKLSAVYALEEAESAIVKWAASDREDGAYSVIEGIVDEEFLATKTLKDKFVKAAIIPVAGVNIVGNIFWSDAVQITGEGADGGAGDVKSANAYLSIAEVKGFDSAFDAFNKRTKYYHTTTSVRAKEANVNFVAEDTKATVEVIANGKKLDGTEGTVALVSGRNTIEAVVTAEDGVTQITYRFVISRTGDNRSTLANLSVDGNNIALTNGIFNYIYNTENERAAIAANAVSENASVVISANGKAVKDGVVELVPGSNKVVIMITAETSSAPTRYTLNIKVPNAANANMESITFGETVKLNNRFAADVMEYSGLATSSKASVAAIAEEADAKVEITVNGKRQAKGEGNVEATLKLKEGANTVVVKVTSPDGKDTKEYVFALEGAGIIYLSDLDWEANSTTGWGSLQKDAEVDGIPITLKDENGAVVKFDKGIGAHANSDVYYNLEEKGYTRFETYVGVDASQGGRGTVQFKVLIDGEILFSTDTMTSNSAMQKAVIEIPADAKVLQLNAYMVENDGNDHADWADAKFFTSFGEEEPEPVESDKSDLDALIEYAQGQKSNEEYQLLVPAVKNAFEAVLAEAERVSADVTATQEEVDEAYEALLAKVHMLGFIGGSTSELEQLYEVLSKLNKDLYTEESVKVLEAALKLAEEVFADGENALKVDIDNALKELEKAQAGLKRRPVDKTKLAALIAEGEGYLEEADKYLSVEDLRTSLASAKEVYGRDDVTQGEINAAYGALLQAIFGLREVPNKEALKDLITAVKAIDLSAYSDTSAKAVKAALAAAIAVYEDDTADQEEVDVAVEALNAAVEALKTSGDEKGSADTSDDTNKNGSNESDNKVASDNGKQTTGKTTSNTTGKSAAKTGDAANTAISAAAGLMAVLAAIIVWRKRTNA